MRYALIGLVAGFFSALFGVGGGIVVVPLLILAASFAPRPAMATSLGAIGVIAAVGALSYGLRGEVVLGAAALVGLPAAIGAVAGSALQQRIDNRRLGLAFAVLLVVIGITLLL